MIEKLIVKPIVCVLIVALPVLGLWWLLWARNWHPPVQPPRQAPLSCTQGWPHIDRIAMAMANQTRQLPGYAVADELYALTPMKHKGWYGPVITNHGLVIVVLPPMKPKWRPAYRMMTWNWATDGQDGQLEGPLETYAARLQPTDALARQIIAAAVDVQGLSLTDQPGRVLIGDYRRLQGNVRAADAACGLGRGGRGPAVQRGLDAHAVPASVSGHHHHHGGL